MSHYYDVWEKLDEVLFEENYDRIVYVYRINSNGSTIKPYLAKCYADQYLLDELRDKYGGGAFKLLIREGRKMVFSGKISIASRYGEQSEGG